MNRVVFFFINLKSYAVAKKPSDAATTTTNHLADAQRTPEVFADVVFVVTTDVLVVDVVEEGLAGVSVVVVVVVGALVVVGVGVAPSSGGA